MKLTKQQTYIATGTVGFLLLAVAIGALVLDRFGSQEGVEDEATSTAEATWTVTATETVDATPGASPAEAELAPTAQPSYVRYARVATVGGTSLSYTVNLDFFDIYTDAEATQYAQQHGLTVPANGILYVDPDSVLTLVPLKSDVVILYYSGGVESLEQRYATPEQLRDWVLGNEAAMPGAMSDMWKVTVEQGIATRLEMVVTAD